MLPSARWLRCCGAVRNMGGHTKWATDSRQPPQGRKIGTASEGYPCRCVKGDGGKVPTASASEAAAVRDGREAQVIAHARCFLEMSVQALPLKSDLCRVSFCLKLHMNDSDHIDAMPLTTGCQSCEVEEIPAQAADYVTASLSRLIGEGDRLIFSQ